MTTREDLWAPFALRVRCGPLELRAITDDDIPLIVDVVRDGVHDPGRMPFKQPWADAPPHELPRATAAYFWASRASFSPSRTRAPQQAPQHRLAANGQRF
jgi:hypothetical protein